MQTDRGRIYIVDASIYVFRAWFSLPDSLAGQDGAPVNAVYGFTRFVTELLEETRPSHVVFAFDGSLASSFRNEIYPEYKANREPAPPELKNQFELCRALISALGMRQLVHDRFEADDIIATVARNMRHHGFDSVIVTSDKDLAQVIEGRDLWWSFPKNDRLSVEGVHERFGVWPHQIADYLALVGDSVDNIPGVPGIGARSAERLLRLYPDLDKLYQNVSQVSQLAIRGAGRIAASLRQNEEQAFRARQLARLVTDVPMKRDAEQFGIGAPDDSELERLTGLIGRGDGYIERIRAVLGN